MAAALSGQSVLPQQLVDVLVADEAELNGARLRAQREDEADAGDVGAPLDERIANHGSRASVVEVDAR